MKKNVRKHEAQGEKRTHEKNHAIASHVGGLEGLDAPNTGVSRNHQQIQALNVGIERAFFVNSTEGASNSINAQNQSIRSIHPPPASLSKLV